MTASIQLSSNITATITVMGTAISDEIWFCVVGILPKNVRRSLRSICCSNYAH